MPIIGLVDTNDLPGSLQRIIAGNDGTREPIAQQVAMVLQLMGGGSLTPVAGGGVQEAPLDGKHYTRQNAAWSALDPIGPWQACTYPAGCSGTLFARILGDPTIGTIEVIGQASSVSQWDQSYNFILAHMPPGLSPSADRFALVPSSSTPGTPDSLSCAWFKATGDVAISFIYSKGQNPLIAWFDAVSIQI